MGNTSLDVCDALTWSLGCTSMPGRAVASVAITSLAFMFELVPDPVWNTSTGNCSSCSPAATSSAAAAIAVGEPRARARRCAPLTRAAAALTRPSARIWARSRPRPEIGKFSTARWVCARHSASAGTLTSPIVSCSIRKPSSVTMPAVCIPPVRRAQRRAPVRAARARHRPFGAPACVRPGKVRARVRYLSARHGSPEAGCLRGSVRCPVADVAEREWLELAAEVMADPAGRAAGGADRRGVDSDVHAGRPAPTACRPDPGQLMVQRIYPLGDVRAGTRRSGCELPREAPAIHPMLQYYLRLRELGTAQVADVPSRHVRAAVRVAAWYELTAAVGRRRPAGAADPHAARGAPRRS